LAQAGVAYIDLIVSVFFLVSLYFSIRFYSTEKSIYLFLAGLSIGLILGMKYTMLLTAIILQIIIVPRLIRRSKKELIIYLVLIFICSSYWYLRNYFILGNPFYPFDLSGLQSTYTSFSDFSIANIINKYIVIMKLFFTKDWGVGSFNGGYGIIFWGLAFPSWIYFLVKSITSNCKNKLINLFVWIQMPIGFLFFLIVPIDEFYLYPRFSIFIIGICLIALGKLIENFHKHYIYKNAIVISCCIFSFLSTFQIARANLPSYSVDIPIYDIINNNSYSNMRYLRLASTSAAFLWETLDYITLNYQQGLDCYYAASLLKYIGPTYGSRLQNRVWNFKEDKSKIPDAFLFLIHDEKKIKYYGKKITIDEVLNNKEYKLIDIAEKAYLYLNKDFLDKNRIISNSLIRHYENYYDYEIKVASMFKNKIINDAPIVTSSYYGIGLQYLNITGKIENPIHILPVNKEPQYIQNNKIKNFYSINKMYDGYNSDLIHKIRPNNNEEIRLYYNSTK
jgi:hypothetical protein